MSRLSIAARGFIAGFFAGNALPYYVEGSTGRDLNPGPWGDHAAVSVLGSGVIALIALPAAAGEGRHLAPRTFWLSAVAGAVAVGLIHTRTWRADVWGRHRPWNSPDTRP